MSSHDAPTFGDTVKLTSRLLFDTDVPRQGVVVAVADDGMVSAEFPQPGTSPMTVTAKTDVFTVVRRAEPRCPSCDHLTSIHQPEGCWYTVTTGRPDTDLVCACSVPGGIAAHA